jgi:outer membrane protein
MIENLAKITLIGLIFFLLGCEPFYDPVCNNDVPASPGSVWDRKWFQVKKTSVNPYTAADLSGTMSLKQLLDIALFNNPLTRSSWHAARAASYAYRASLSAYYPAFSYAGILSAQTVKGTNFAASGSSAIITNNTTPVLITQTFSTNLINSLNLTYLLLDFGGREAVIDTALQTLYAANWQHDYTMQQVMLSVLNAYVSYLGNKGLVEAYELDLKDAQIAVNAAKAMYEAGLATLTDVLSAEANLELTKANLAQSQGAERTSFGEILIAIGLPPDTCISIENLPQKLPVIEISGSLSCLLELAKQKRPDLGVAVSAIKLQEDQLALAYSNSMPKITANGNWTQVRFISPPRPSGYNETAFITMTMPIFQGFYYMNQERQFRAQIEEAMANLDVQVAAVSTQVLTNYYLFKSAEAALPASAAAVAFSDRAYRGFVVQYKTGTASVTDMLNSLTVLSNARAQEVVNRTQWASSLANLAFSVGVLTDNSGEFREVKPKKTSQTSIRNDNEFMCQ